MWKKLGKYYSYNEVISAMEIVDYLGDVDGFADQFCLQYKDESEDLIEELISEGYEAKAAYVYRKLYDTTLREAYDKVQERINAKKE